MSHLAENRVVFLGTGTSYGVPRLGCQCEVCVSSDPRNRRTRCSGLLEVEGRRILIDVGPDFRQQALREGLDRVDAVVITHVHADHVMGLDDLRPLSLDRQEALVIHAHAAACRELRDLFPYIFRTDRRREGIPWLTLQEIQAGIPFLAAGVELVAASLPHGGGQTLGLRWGPFAWVTDVKSLPSAALEALKGVRWLALDMLRREPHPTHLCLDESLAFRQALGEPETWFIHMSHEVDHGPFDAALPPGCRLAWDGHSLGFGPRELETEGSSRRYRP
ncbi:MAG: MBL fold metallo-hydrolase [Planctomycetes bacterium]|nr:MBL fold metallo-hydrolase [Planctomycetota bacterium]